MRGRGRNKGNNGKATPKQPQEQLNKSVMTDSKNTQTEVKNSAPGLRNTPKMELVLTKAIVLRALTTIFEEVYGKERVKEMEAALKNILQRSEENEAICEKLFDQNGIITAPDNIRVEMGNLIEKFCKSGHTPMRSDTPESLFELAKLFNFLGDLRISAELLWGAASLALRQFASNIENGIEFHSHHGKILFAKRLSTQIGLFMTNFAGCHEAFYTGTYTKFEIEESIRLYGDFIKELKQLNLSQDKKTELYACRSQFR